MLVPFWRHAHKYSERGTAWKTISYDALCQRVLIRARDYWEQEAEQAHRWAWCYRVSCLGQCMEFLVNGKKKPQKEWRGGFHPTTHSIQSSIPSNHSCIYLYIHSFIHSSIDQSIHPSVCPSICLFIHSSLSIQSSIYPSNHSCIHSTFPSRASRFTY